MRVFQMTAALVMVLFTGIGASTNRIPASWIILSKQTATVAGITATIRVVVEYRGMYGVDGVWTQQPASHYAIGCLDAYRSLKYELRDSGGHVVPVNKELLRSGDVLAVGGHAAATYKENCAAYPPRESGVLLANLRNRLPSLYGNLHPGKYTLQITFAPAGLTQEATLEPISITIPSK